MRKIIGYNAEKIVKKIWEKIRYREGKATDGKVYYALGLKILTKDEIIQSGPVRPNVM